MIPKHFNFSTHKMQGEERYFAIQCDEGFDVHDKRTGKFIGFYTDTEVSKNLGTGDWEIIEADNVNHPDHYQGKTEVIDIIEQATQGLQGINAVCTGNVIKYVMRFQKKGGVEDLKKAQWYLDKLIGGYENE